MKSQLREALVVLAIIAAVVAQSGYVFPPEVRIAGLFPVTGINAKLGGEAEAASRIAVEKINSDRIIRANTSFVFTSFDTGSSEEGGLNAIVLAAEARSLGILGPESSAVAKIVSTAGNIFNLPQLSYAATADSLNNKDVYSYFNRMLSPDSQQATALAYFVDHYQWNDFTAIIATSDEYGLRLADNFVEKGRGLNIKILTLQEFASGRIDDIDLVLSEIKRTKARLIVNFMIASDFRLVYPKAVEQNLVGNQYVWMCSDACASNHVFFQDQEELPLMKQYSRGIIGTQPLSGNGDLYDAFLDDWEKRDPREFAGSGDRTIDRYAPFAYDGIFAYAHALELLRNSSTVISFLSLNQIFPNVTFNGITGWVSFNSLGERLSSYEIVNYRGKDDFESVGRFNITTRKLSFKTKPMWFDGSTTVPDLDVRKPFDYWSCFDKKQKTDETGKTIERESVDGNPNNINIDYRCDQFLDCNNMSDEDGCTPSFPIAFIIIGTGTGLLIILAFIFGILTCVFSYCHRMPRIRAASPIFLLMIVGASIMGYGSTYAFYGKHQTVACNFRVWLLSISITLMISSLIVKSFRIWRIFRNPLRPTVIKDYTLIILVILLTLPVIILDVLWTAVATPHASIVKSDGMDHYLCNTGGVGEPVGYVFFGLIVGYIGIVLLIGVILSILTRKAPSRYNESKLIAISVYNLTFLSCVIIPVYFIVNPVSPIGAWILLMIAILYGFSATLFLQFVPRLVGVVIKDRLSARSNTVKEMSDGRMKSSKSGSKSNTSTLGTINNTVSSGSL